MRKEAGNCEKSDLRILKLLVTLEKDKKYQLTQLNSLIFTTKRQ